MPRGFPHCRMIEVPIQQSQLGSNQIAFPDQPDLRYARVLAIEAFTNQDVTYSQPSGYPVISGLQLPSFTLVLETNDADDVGVKNPATGKMEYKYNKGDGRFTSTQQNVKYLPLSSLHRIQNDRLFPYGSSAIYLPDNFVRQMMEFDNMYVSWDKCFLTIAPTLTASGITTMQAVVLMVYYSWLDIHGNPIKRT